MELTILTPNALVNFVPYVGNKCLSVFAEEEDINSISYYQNKTRTNLNFACSQRSHEDITAELVAKLCYFAFETVPMKRI